MSRNAIRVMIPLSRAALSKKAIPVAFQPARSILSFRRPVSPWGFFDDGIRQMERQFERMERDMNNLIRDFGRSRPAGVDGFLKPPVESEQAAEAIGAPNKYSLNIHVGEDFPPENIKISMKDRVMTVEAKVEHKSEDGTSRVYQEVMRKFTLPENIDLKEVKSILTPEGILTIEAPLPQKELPKPKEIPIASAGENDM